MWVSALMEVQAMTQETCCTKPAWQCSYSAPQGTPQVNGGNKKQRSTPRSFSTIIIGEETASHAVP